MEMHNTTEDLVLRMVNDIFNAAERERKADQPCTCYQCRLDTACYVLNRSTPRYIISSRGAARTETATLAAQQQDADIASLIHEGWQKISKSKRPHFEHYPIDTQDNNFSMELGPVFNIPTFIGRIFNGINFEPMNNLEILLYKDGSIAQMKNSNWQNPYHLVINTAGTFTFWPQTESATQIGLVRTFKFAIHATALGFDDIRHYFELSLVSESHSTISFSVERSYKIVDLYMFPHGTEIDK